MSSTAKKGEPSEAEQLIVRRLAEYGAELSKKALLKLLRHCEGNEELATKKVIAIVFGEEASNAMIPEPSSEGSEGGCQLRPVGHMIRGGSTEYEVVFEDDDPFDEDGDMLGDGDEFLSCEAISSEDHQRERESVAEHVKGSPSADETEAATAPPRTEIHVWNGGKLANGSFLNEGISLRQRRDWWEMGTSPGAVGCHTVEIKIYLNDLSEEEFQRRCQEWLMWESDGSSGDEDDEEFENFFDDDAVRTTSSAAKGGKASQDFKSYMGTLMSETPEQRAARIEQGRQDARFAAQLMQEDIAEQEQMEKAIAASMKTYSQERGKAGKERAKEATKARRDADAARAKEEAEERRSEEHNDNLRPESCVDGSTISLPARLKEFKDRGYRINKSEIKTLKKRIRELKKGDLTAMATTAPTYYDEWKGNNAFTAVKLTLPPGVNVTRVENVLSRHHEEKFRQKIKEFNAKGIDATVEFGYHGTSADVVPMILQNGFRVPNQSTQHASGNNGWYGNGVYASPSPQTAQGYISSSVGGSYKLIVVNVLRGRVYICTGMEMGRSLASGYNSHQSPEGYEWVFYDNAQIIPVAIIHFNHDTQRRSYLPRAVAAQVNEVQRQKEEFGGAPQRKKKREEEQKRKPPKRDSY